MTPQTAVATPKINETDRQFKDLEELDELGSARADVLVFGSSIKDARAMLETRGYEEAKRMNVKDTHAKIIMNGVMAEFDKLVADGIISEDKDDDDSESGTYDDRDGDPEAASEADICEGAGGESDDEVA